ncbi:MAG: hypothetical protein ACTSRI_10815 [Promethearchaeota archaeon]
MNFTIPRKNFSEMLFYLWKVIDLPIISYNDLLYKISFELFLQSPEKAMDFIDKSIEKKMLIKDVNNNISLSHDLTKKLKIWQEKRKNEILNKKNLKQDLKNDMKEENNSNFTTLLKAFLDKGTLNRAATIPSTAFNINIIDLKKGLIKTSVAGTKKELYYIKIDTKRKILCHDCHDFQTRRAENKKFCKHLIKLFLILKDKNIKSATIILKKIAENIDEWEFLSKF